jgi:metal-responsive CopG/Arc/MetJ family transcriptional regulator
MTTESGAVAAKGYVTISLPAELVDRIDAFLTKNTWGYRSRAEMVAASVRDFLQAREAEAKKK